MQLPVSRLKTSGEDACANALLSWPRVPNGTAFQSSSAISHSVWAQFNGLQWHLLHFLSCKHAVVGQFCAVLLCIATLQMAAIAWLQVER